MRKGLLGSAIVATLVSGCGGTGPTPSAQSTGLVPVVPSPLPPRRQTIVLTGQVAYLNDRSPVAGVCVRLGRGSGYAGVSEPSGSVRIALPQGATVASLLCNAPRTFSVAVPSGGQWQVSYRGGLHPAESVPLTADVVLGRSTSLGIIAIVASPPTGDGDAPPLPPSFAD